MTAIVLRGDAAALPLPDATVDLICTSPPYWSLRSYQDDGEHYDGQIGDEPTASAYIDNLVRCTREWLRVLKPTGSLFVNIGDKYGPDKSLLMLPERYAIQCREELGVIIRAEICWSKPNGLPESVTDRVRRSHELVFHFVKSSRYYSAVDEVREPQDPANLLHHAKYHGRYTGTNPDRADKGVSNMTPHPLGKLPGSVWTIPTAPLTVPPELGVDHFAAYPPELVKRIVAGWSPREVCTACGEGRRPVAEVTDRRPRTSGGATTARTGRGGGITMSGGTGGLSLNLEAVRSITGYACACPDTTAPTTPGIVLDPFGGTGTTALVASCLGRVGITNDMSHDYSRLARWRVNDPGERARVLEVPKPEKPVEGQLGLFEGLGA